MARIARVVAPSLPHHITQRGNRRQATFFCEGDYEEYIHLMCEWCSHWNVEVWAYCLMPNHVHMIAVPESEAGLRRAIGEAHLAATRYVELNPVRAGLVKDPAAYPWSSAAAHLAGRDATLVKVEPLLAMVGNWREFLLS
jgi:putative transposase